VSNALRSLIKTPSGNAAGFSRRPLNKQACAVVPLFGTGTTAGSSCAILMRSSFLGRTNDIVGSGKKFWGEWCAGKGWSWREAGYRRMSEVERVRAQHSNSLKHGMSPPSRPAARTSSRNTRRSPLEGIAHPVTAATGTRENAGQIIIQCPSRTAYPAGSPRSYPGRRSLVPRRCATRAPLPSALVCTNSHVYNCRLRACSSGDDGEHSLTWPRPSVSRSRNARSILLLLPDCRRRCTGQPVSRHRKARR